MSEAGGIRRLLRLADPGFVMNVGRHGVAHLRQLFREYRQQSWPGADPTTAAIVRRDRVNVPTLGGVVIGEGSTFAPDARLFTWSSGPGREHGKIDVGRSVLVARDFLAESYTGQVLRLGDFATFGEHCAFIGNVSIGAHCLVSWHVFGSSGTHHARTFPAWLIHDQDLLALADPSWTTRHDRPIVVDEDCWLGWGVFLKDGIHVGRGAIVGAHSVVTKDVEPYAVVAGNPARTIGRRLVFAPPALLSARDESQLPYFYEGFLVRRNELAERPGAVAARERARLVLRGGSVSRVVLDGVWSAPSGGASLDVSVNGRAVGTIPRGDDRFSVAFEAASTIGTTSPRLLSAHTVVDLHARGTSRASPAFAIIGARVVAEHAESY